MSRTLVIEHRSVVVSLTSAGFESVHVNAPVFAVEHELIAAVTGPARPSARCVITTLLAGCLSPSPGALAIETLDTADRARLRLALVEVCQESSVWRGLYGSHLSADERLMAVMVSRTRRAQAALGEIVAKIAVRRAKLAGASGATPRVTAAARTASVFALQDSAIAQAQRAMSNITGMARAYSKLTLTQPGIQWPYLAGLGAGPAGSDALALATGAARTHGLLGVGEPSWLKGITGIGRPTGVAAVSRSLIDAGKVSSVYASLIPVRSPSILETIRGTLGKLAHAWEGFEDVDRFIRIWERDALWLLFEGIDVGVSRGLARLERDDVEAIVLDALERICSDGRYVPALRHAIATAPHLNPSLREHLDHALEHAGEREYIKASGSLYFGLEGAYREAAYASAILPRPASTKKAVGFETVVKLMGLTPEVKKFVVRAVFGGTGNAVRHGQADGIERRQVLLGVAAIAAWIENFAGEPALELLAEHVGAILPQAIQQRRRPALAAGAARPLALAAGT